MTAPRARVDRSNTKHAEKGWNTKTKVGLYSDANAKNDSRKDWFRRVNGSAQRLVTVWPDYLCFFDAASSWTSSSRRTSCSHWWRGYALQRTVTSPLCLTHRRPSPPPPNASPKGTPRSMHAGNCGSCKTERILLLYCDWCTGFMRPSGSLCLSSLLIFSTFGFLLSWKSLAT